MKHEFIGFFLAKLKQNDTCPSWDTAVVYCMFNTNKQIINRGRHLYLTKKHHKAGKSLQEKMKHHKKREGGWKCPYDAGKWHLFFFFWAAHNKVNRDYTDLWQSFTLTLTPTQTLSVV